MGGCEVRVDPAHRTVRRLLDDRDDVLAEVSDDRVSSQGPGETVPRAWRELEIELVGADSSLLDSAARLLKDHGLEPSDTQSKLRRASVTVPPMITRPPSRHEPGRVQPSSRNDWRTWSRRCAGSTRWFAPTRPTRCIACG